MFDFTRQGLVRLTLARRQRPAGRWQGRALSALCLLAALMPAALGAPASADTGPAQGTWAFTGRMHDGRYSHTATLLSNGQVLVAGGTSSIIIAGGPFPSLISAELYHPATGRWTQTGFLNVARTEHTATLLPNGQVLVTGGFSCTDTTCTRLASAELYDPTTGAWSLTGSLLDGRDLQTATLLPDGQVLIAGGIDVSHNFTTSAELYDPASGTFTATGSMNDGRAAATATLLPNGKVLLAGGFLNGIDQASAELYDPSSGTWTLTGSMSTPRDGHTATLLPNGTVLVAGGFNGTTPITPSVAGAEIYDPSTGTWTPTGSLHVARNGHTATLLPNGQVLAAGGYPNFSPGSTASAELYDPATGTWQPAAHMEAARARFTATLLPNGQVLVAGGAGNNLHHLAINSAEIYTP